MWREGAESRAGGTGNSGDSVGGKRPELPRVRGGWVFCVGVGISGSRSLEGWLAVHAGSVRGA